MCPLFSVFTLIMKFVVNIVVYLYFSIKKECSLYLFKLKKNHFLKKSLENANIIYNVFQNNL